LIEIWFLLFLIIHIRNKFIHNLEKNNIYIYQKYNFRQLLKHWSIYPPMIMLFTYCVLEILYFNNYYQISKYTNIFKSITILSYFGLVCKYDLYDSMYDKYKGKGFISFITSPFVLAIICLFIGYFINYIAISMNSGHMPVFPSYTFFTGYTDIEEFTKDSFYILGDHTSKAIIFCDTIDIFYSNLSIGDLFVRCYVFIILFFSVKKSNKNLTK